MSDSRASAAFSRDCLFTGSYACLYCVLWVFMVCVYILCNRKRVVCVLYYDFVRCVYTLY